MLLQSLHIILEKDILLIFLNGPFNVFKFIT